MASRSGRPTRRAVLLALSCVALAAAACRPGWSWPGRVGRYVFALDITQSMNVRDGYVRGLRLSRLELAKRLVSDALPLLHCGDEAGVAVFTERRTLVLLAPVEVCAHRAALLDTLSQVSSQMAWAADTHLYYGVQSALSELEHFQRGAALAFFSDGHQAPALLPGREPGFVRSKSTPGGVLFGVGGLVPQPVPKLDEHGDFAGYWTAEEAAGYASAGETPLSVVDLERMAQGEDVRNRPQRAPAAAPEHLSARHDETLRALAQAYGLAHQTPSSGREVAAALRQLPAHSKQRVRHDLHVALALLGLLAFLSSLIPQRFAPMGADRTRA